MKYLLMFCWQIALVGFLLFTIIYKAIASALMILWDFGIVKKHHKFWTAYIAFIPPFFFIEASLKDYLMFKYKNWKL